MYDENNIGMHIYFFDFGTGAPQPVLPRRSEIAARPVVNPDELCGQVDAKPQQ